MKYHTLTLLSDVGAGEATGEEAWSFGAEDRTTKDSYIIRDHWVEDRAGKHLEHDIVTRVKNDMGDPTFHQHFILGIAQLSHLGKIWVSHITIPAFCGRWSFFCCRFDRWVGSVVALMLGVMYNVCSPRNKTISTQRNTTIWEMIDDR